MIKAGWVAGAGIEAMLAPNWTLRGAWLHIDLGTITNTLSTVGNNGGVQTTAWRGARSSTSSASA
jgi:opacity protein-like surface antigen